MVYFTLVPGSLKMGPQHCPKCWQSNKITLFKVAIPVCFYLDTYLKELLLFSCSWYCTLNTDKIGVGHCVSPVVDLSDGAYAQHRQLLTYDTWFLFRIFHSFDLCSENSVHHCVSCIYHATFQNLRVKCKQIFAQ